MGDCGCSKKRDSATKITPPQPATKQTPTAPKGHISGTYITKAACPKCSYWMSLHVSPSTKEKTYICQNTMCKHSMPYSPPSQSQSL